MSTMSQLRANSPASNRPDVEGVNCLRKPTRHRPGKTLKSRRTTPIENGISGSCCGCANWMSACERRAFAKARKRRNHVRQSLRELVLTLRASPLSQALETWIQEDEP